MIPIPYLRLSISMKALQTIAYHVHRNILQYTNFILKAPQAQSKDISIKFPTSCLKLFLLKLFPIFFFNFDIS